MSPCHMCKYKSRLWGMEYCLLDQWAGKDFEKRCSEYTRAEDSVIHWHNTALTGAEGVRVEGTVMQQTENE